MDVKGLSGALDAFDYPRATASKALIHLSGRITAVIAAVEGERRLLTWSERNLLASALKAMERENWLLARAFIWNAIQLDGQGRRVFGEEHRARLSKLTSDRLMEALKCLRRDHRLPATFWACAPPHVPHARA